jgi:site-specific recombinase XerD
VIEAVQDLIRGKEVKQEDYIFASPRQNQNGEKGNPILKVQPGIDRICKAAGVTKRVTPHLFRHSIATHMV